MPEKAKPTSEVIGPDHPISALANDISQMVFKLAHERELSHWNVCEAFANACGLILAASKDMPRDVAMDRLDSLRLIMGGAYDLYDVQGEA